MEEQLFFLRQAPGMLPLYEALREVICREFDGVTIKVAKTQISFSNRHIFACVSLPYRKVKDRPDAYFILTLGLGYKLEHARVAQVVEPYPGRWTHHILLQEEAELDGQIKEWLRQAYSFAEGKRPRRAK